MGRASWPVQASEARPQRQPVYAARPGASLADRLADLFKTHAAAVVFIRGDKALEFREVADVMDLAKGAGVTRIGLMTQ